MATDCACSLCRYAERTNIEIQLFNIQTKLRAAKQKNWYPPEGKLVSDINKVYRYFAGVWKCESYKFILLDTVQDYNT